MRDKEIQEGLADLAQRAEMDHEVQMARSDLYKIAKYAIKLHDMLKNVSEAEGLEGWKQSKITKAADYIGSVKHYLESSNARSTGALEEAIDREKLVQLAMGIINNMDDSDLEEFINNSENKR